MGKIDVGSVTATKKKRKRRRKEKETWKRTRLPTNQIFKEASFDSSSDEYGVPEDIKQPHKTPKPFLFHSEVMSIDCDHALFLKPSKSECEMVKRDDSDTELNETLCSLDDESFEVSSQEESYIYGDVINEFLDHDQDNSNSQIISVSEDSKLDESLTREKKRQLKTIKTQAKRNNSNTADNSGTFDSKVQCYYTNDGIILVLSKQETVHFYGLFAISVLHGQIEVLGHTITKNSQEMNLYSTRGTALLYLRNITKSNIPVTTYLLNLKVLEKANLGENCSVVLCKKLEDANLFFIEKHISQQILPANDKPTLPRVVFQPYGGYNYLKTDEMWNEIVDKIKKSTKMIICGGKGVGKTTFLRYAVNRLLLTYGEIKIIDLDPGQSEFTVPGCISVIKVRKPIFGVNYSHLMTAERSILSNINISYEPKKYIESVKCLLNIPPEEIPTLINYMGYTHGIGINILSAVIACVQPTDVLQIQSEKSKKNYKYALDTNVVARNAGLFLSDIPDVDYDLHQIESLNDRTEGGWTAEPRQLREMCILSHFSKMFDSNSIFKTKSPMYRINLSKIIITDLKGEKIHPAAVNAGLVALCVLEGKAHHIYQCCGWGIVRGIDLTSNYLVLLTTEVAKVLDKVTHLVSNGVTLPPSIYMTPDDVIDQIPYVVEGVLSSFGQIPKRSRVPSKGE